MMRGKIIAALAAALLTITTGVVAQVSGYPSRPRFQSLTVNSLSLTPTNSTGTVTLSSGCTTTPAVTYTVRRIGTVVMVHLGGTGAAAFSCTQNTTIMTFTALPSEARPSSARWVAGGTINDGGTIRASIVSIDTAGVMQIFTASGSGTPGWNGAGTGAMNSATLVYPL